ncbi:hypothetical protein D3C76_1216740 [compost metagenome]
MSVSITAPNSLPALHCSRTPENREPTGLVIPAWKRGFCNRIAESRVEPERGKPEMK